MAVETVAQPAPPRPAGRAAALSAVRLCSVISGRVIQHDAGGQPSSKRTVIALLPRAMYLTRVVEIPAADPADTRRMLQLDIVAEFPPEFGDVDLSYRRLGDSSARGSVRYEVYIVRRSRMREFTAALEGAGLSPDYFLPSAVAWCLLHQRVSSDVPLITVQWQGDQLEAAAVEPGGELTLRALTASRSEPREIVEFLRTRPLGGSESGGGWIGGEAPLNGHSRVSFEDVGRHVGVAEPGATPFLQAAASLLQASGITELVHTANLLPLETIAARQHQRTLRGAALAAALMLVGIGLLLVALAVASSRYGARRDALAAQLATIRGEGQRIGTQIEQLRTIRSARSTRHDFARIMTGLFDATPSGVTYSQVDLERDRSVILRGQAESLALPFLLPEKLEATPVFKEALLRDAGQTSQGQGQNPVVEFRLEAKLKEGGR